MIIATRNQAENLDETLWRLRSQASGSLRWELVVVDNGSSDDTKRVLSEHASRLPLCVVYEPVRGKPRALNRGVDVARGRLILFTDADVSVCEGWMAEMVGAARRWPEASVFCGPIRPVFDCDPPEWLISHRFAAEAFARFDPPFPEGPLPRPYLPFGPNFAVRADVFRLERFNVQLGPGRGFLLCDDIEFLLRLRRAGREFVYVPSAPVSHRIEARRLRFRSLFRRAYDVGKAAAWLRPRSASPGNGMRHGGVMSVAAAAVSYLRSLTMEREAQFDYGIRLCFRLGVLSMRLSRAPRSGLEDLWALDAAVNELR